MSAKISNQMGGNHNGKQFTQDQINYIGNMSQDEQQALNF